MKRSYAAAAGIAVVATLALAGCSGGGDEAAAPEESGPVTLSLSGWSLDTTPEFQALADAFHEENPDITVEVKGYDAA
jgi:multiple sugar transport system substrate-binding protein